MLLTRPDLTQHNVLLGSFFTDFFSINEILYFLKIGRFQIFTNMKYFGRLISKYSCQMFVTGPFVAGPLIHSTFHRQTFRIPEV
jgi:hypothetical protein